MCTWFPRIRTVFLALGFTLIVVWFIGIDPSSLANLSRDSAQHSIWHAQLKQPSAELGIVNAQSVLHGALGSVAETSADMNAHVSLLDSQVTQTLPITNRTIAKNIYGNLSGSCQSTLWAPRSLACKGPPQLPSNLPPDKVKKHKFRLKAPIVLRFHNQKCAYEETRSALKTELAIILMPISIVEAGIDNEVQDRINMLTSAYRSHFSHIAIVGSKLNFTASPAEDLTVWACDKSDDTHSFAYICVARFLQWIATQSRFADFLGFSFFHTDFWLHPSHLAALLSEDPKAILSLSVPSSREGWPNFRSFAADFTDHVCCQVKEFWKSRFHKDQKNHGNIKQSGSPEHGYIKDPSNFMWKTFQRIDQELFEPANRETGMVCYGWADMFRLPRDQWDQFSKYAMLFAAISDTRDKHHEVVIPTLLHKLAVKANRNVKMMECWGGTIAITFKKTIFEVYPCGHRMQLQMPSVRFDFVDAVRCG